MDEATASLDVDNESLIQIAESGNPEELKAKKGVYAHMVSTQLQAENWKMA
jgi:ABC-type multidrug transport system fused ATPase/permease subunit